MNEQIQFLKELQATMKHEDEHDYDSQASPRFWVIMDHRTVPGNEDCDNGNDEHFFKNGDHVVFKKFSDLKEFIEGHYEEEINEDEDLQELLKDENESFYELWDYIENNLNDDGYFSKVFVKEESFIRPDTMFLTKEEAKSHLKLNHYHYTSKAHTYAMTAWRAPKVEQLLNLLQTFDWDSIDKLELEVKKLKMAQYKYKCSGCGYFEKYLSRTCPNCERQNYFTGSFKQEDLEQWLEEKQAI